MNYTLKKMRFSSIFHLRGTWKWPLSKNQSRLLNCSKRFRSRLFFPWSLGVSMTKQWYRLRKLCDFSHQSLNKIKMVKVNQTLLKSWKMATSSLFSIINRKISRERERGLFSQGKVSSFWKINIAHKKFTQIILVNTWGLMFKQQSTAWWQENFVDRAPGLFTSWGLPVF